MLHWPLKGFIIKLVVDKVGYVEFLRRRVEMTLLRFWKVCIVLMHKYVEYCFSSSTYDLVWNVEKKRGLWFRIFPVYSMRIKKNEWGLGCWHESYKNNEIAKTEYGRVNDEGKKWKYRKVEIHLGWKECMLLLLSHFSNVGCCATP